MTDYKAVFDDMMNHGVNEVFGLRFDRIDDEGVAISLTVGSAHLQPWGIVHGGVYCALHETAASVAGQVWFGDRGTVVGTNNNTDFLKQAGEGAEITATATPIHRGRSQQLWLVETRDAEGVLLARGQVRLANLAGKPADS